jgi:Zn-dependent protease with chaperone function
MAQSALSRIRLRPAIVVAVVLALLWLTAYWHLHQLSWNLVQVSRPGPRALALYLAGNYGDAARAYRAGLQGRLEAQYLEDPTGSWALRAGNLEGMKMLLVARIDPAGMIAFFDGLAKQEGTKTAAFKYLSTHPIASDRTARLRGMASEWQSTPVKLLPSTDWARLAKLC